MTEPLVLLREDLVPASQASLAIYDAGVAMGATVTDMVRTIRHRPFRLDDHLDRFFASLSAVGFELTLSRAQLSDRLQQLVQHNTQFIDKSQDLSLAMFATAGELARYAGHTRADERTTLCAHTFPLACDLWADDMRNGAHVVTSSIRQIPADTLDPSIKHRSRLHYYLANKQAARLAPGAIPLLLDHHDHVTESVAANFLLVRGRTLVSPKAHQVLPGVSLMVVRELAEQLGLSMAYEDLTAADILAADEALLASTPYSLLPVVKCNHTTIGSGIPGPVFTQLMNAWCEFVDFDIRQQILT